MKKKEKSTLRKLQRKNTESIYLIIRGVEVGIASSLVCVLYRFLLSKAEEYLYIIIDYIKSSPLKTALWLFLLALIGAGVSFIIKAVPDSGGSGIPQVNAEIRGYMSPPWLKVILAKLAGSTAAVFSGLSLGREGPSVQFGAMAAKGVAKITKADKTTELRMISSGAGAGISAAFNAPLAGIMFVLEEIHHTFDKSVLCMGIVATVTADFISKIFFGQDTVFHYESTVIPLRWYWLLIALGIILGVFGCLYNIIMVAAKNIYAKIAKVPPYIKMAFVFALSGVVGLLLPQVLCGGHTMAELLINERPAVTVMILLFVAKFFFGVFSFASGAPGGTLYPMCILGTYIGAIYGQTAIGMFNLSDSLWQEFVVLGMAGLFASIVRAPITGVILVFEITGNMDSLLPLVAVSLISYATASTIGTAPFYGALLEDITRKTESGANSKPAEKVLKSYVVPTGSPIDGKAISDIEWGKHCLIVSVERGEGTITPKGDTIIKSGDTLVFMVSQRRFSRDINRLEKLING